MLWDTEYTDEFGKWWDGLTEGGRNRCEPASTFRAISARICRFPIPVASEGQGTTTCANCYTALRDTIEAIGWNLDSAARFPTAW